MQIDVGQLPQLAKNSSKSTKTFFKKLKKNPPKRLDTFVQQLHEEVFAQTDCLTCANCCKTTSPIFTNKDIERIAKHIGQKPGQFISHYLHIDEDGDYVLNSSPCSFLNLDNTCSIYEQRPNACQEYPHTNRKKFHQLLNLTLKNTYICPATFKIVEKLKASI